MKYMHSPYTYECHQFKNIVIQSIDKLERDKGGRLKIITNLNQKNIFVREKSNFLGESIQLC